MFVRDWTSSPAVTVREDVSFQDALKLPRTPNSDLVRGSVDLDECGCIPVDVNCATNAPGAFAAGDVTHVSEQVLVHIGEGAKAAISASNYLLEHCP